MKKFRLELDDLRIDSFSTTPAQAPKGTVFGEQCTCYTNCTCPGCPTCDRSCNGTCYASCNATCDASCNGTCDATCVDCGTYETCGYTCDPTCYGFATYGGPNQVCVAC